MSGTCPAHHEHAYDLGHRIATHAHTYAYATSDACLQEDPVGPTHIQQRACDAYTVEGL